MSEEKKSTQAPWAAQDANFANLRVWQDLNQDGISQANELTTLEQQGIASFNVGSTKNLQSLSNGNQVADLGTYTKTNGSTGTTGAVNHMADINLSVDTFHRSFADVIPTTRREQMALLDDLLAAWGATSGFGDMRCVEAANDARYMQMGGRHV